MSGPSADLGRLRELDAGGCWQGAGGGLGRDRTVSQGQAGAGPRALSGAARLADDGAADVYELVERRHQVEQGEAGPAVLAVRQIVAELGLAARHRGQGARWGQAPGGPEGGAALRALFGESRGSVSTRCPVEGLPRPVGSPDSHRHPAVGPIERGQVRAAAGSTRPERPRGELARLAGGLALLVLVAELVRRRQHLGGWIEQHERPPEPEEW